MRTRRTYYKDYGIDGEEIKRLKEICSNLDDEEDYLLKNATQYACPDLADQIYRSIKNNISYDVMVEKEYVPIGKGDFYGYRRKSVYIFMNLLIFSGKYKRA